MPLDRVFKDLQFFLDNNVKLVKFVDRTYNLDDERYIAIWDYILNHHNGKTMFHFEIEAEYLSQNALNFLQNPINPYFLYTFSKSITHIPPLLFYH